MYAHDKLSDIAAEHCFTEMYPKGKKVEIQESDEPCLIFCVLKKIGIMNSNGQINLEIYRLVTVRAYLNCVDRLWDYRAIIGDLIHVQFERIVGSLIVLVLRKSV